MAAAVRRYFRALVAEGFVEYSVSGITARYASHNEPIASLLHRQLQPVAARIFDAPLVPSYAFFSRYESGADLRPHVDRRAGESALLGARPETG